MRPVVPNSKDKLEWRGNFAFVEVRDSMELCGRVWRSDAVEETYHQNQFNQLCHNDKIAVGR